jgi:hypothetical protein
MSVSSRARPLLAAAALVTVSLCAGRGPGDSSGPSERSSAAPAPTSAGPGGLPLGTVVKLPTGNTIAVTDVAWWTPSAGHPRPGRSLLAAKARACASRSATATTALYPEAFSVLLDDGTEASVDYSVPAREPMLAVGDLAPGDCISGWVTLEVRDGRTPVLVLLGEHARFDVSSVGPAG